MKYVDACRDKSWHLHVWPMGEVCDGVRVPYRCRSWRHAGDCSRWRGAQDFVRVSEAISKHTGWTVCVLTYPRNDWPDVASLYRAGVVHWARLRKRLTRQFGPCPYVQTWERHRSGWPHVNVVIANPSLQLSCCDTSKGWKSSELERHAVASGFGPVHYAEPLRSIDALAGYLVKLARELTGSDVKDQTPRNAPRHFRRLRASRGLLPPPYKSPGMTGTLVKSPCPVAKTAIA